MPATTLKNVVLPAPFGPMRLTIEPLGIDEVGLVDGDQAAEALGDRLGMQHDLGRVRRRVAGPSAGGVGSPERLPSCVVIPGRMRRPADRGLRRPRRQVIGGVQLGRPRWLGNRPSGRSSIMPTRARPYSRYWYCTKSMSLGSGRGSCRRTC